VVGTYAAFCLRRRVPGHDFIPRLYIVHVLLIPGIILALITAHLMLVWYQKHTQFPGPGRTENNVVGYPLFPVYTAKAGGFFFIVFGVTVLLSAVASRSTRCGCSARTRRPRSPPGRSPTGTWAGSTAPCADAQHRVHAWGHTLSLNVLVPSSDHPGHPVHRAGALPVPRAVGHRRQARAPPARPPAQRPDPHGDRHDVDRVLRAAVDRRRQRHHRHPLRPLDQPDHLDAAGPASSSCRRSCS
jgi:hypothetical protein